jgi:hypothetical protein
MLLFFRRVLNERKKERKKEKKKKKRFKKVIRLEKGKRI